MATQRCQSGPFTTRGLACKRQRWTTHQHRIDPQRLVFIDETWVKTNMAHSAARDRGGDAWWPMFLRVTGRRLPS